MTTENKFYKYLSLILLLSQNVMLALAIRYSKMNASKKNLNYLTSVVILFSETLKFFVCHFLVLFESGSILDYLKQINTDLIQKPLDVLRIAVPGGLFTVQNNLTFVALSYMDAASFQVLSQLKILTTAVMSILMLKTKLDKFKWTSIFLLLIGVTLIEVNLEKI
jgi:UDP-sugar transporter A1/2/3